METFLSFLSKWGRDEPIASLWLAIGSIMFLRMTFVHSNSTGTYLATWGGRLIRASVLSLIFVALTVGFYVLLNQNYTTFHQIYGSYRREGSLSNQNWQEQRNRYGGAYIQEDLQVIQYIPVKMEEVIQADDTNRLPLYRYTEGEQPLQQNSIIGFQGYVTLDLIDIEQESKAFNIYTLSARYQYKISNPSETTTRAEFGFPISPNTKIYNLLDVRINGVSTPYNDENGQEIKWEYALKPQETIDILIDLQLDGMEGYFFRINEKREIINFELKIATNADGFWFTEPNSDSLRLENQVWSIERAIMAPQLGFSLREHWPYAPYHEMTQALPYVPVSLILFLTLLVFTFLIFSSPVTLHQVALILCLFSIPFLLLVAGGIPVPAFITPEKVAGYQVKMFPFISIFPIILAFFILRKQPRIPLILTLMLMFGFMAGYPWLGLLPNEQKRNAIEIGIQSAMIGYIFALAFFIRIRSHDEKYHHPLYVV